MAVKTVSLETAKALKDAGFRQDTYFYWNHVMVNNRGKLEWQLDYRKIGDRNNIPAPTTDKLLEELPCQFKYGGAWFDLQITKWPKEYKVQYVEFYFNDDNLLEISDSLCEFKVESLPEALAQMWLWLKKEGLLCK